MYKGSRGFLIGNYRDGSRLLLPSGDNADLTYFARRTSEAVLPPRAHFVKEWIEACKDPSRKTSCDFERHGNMREQNLLGLVAYRVGKTITYDGNLGQVTNSSLANELLSKPYRRGWSLDG